MVTWMLYSPLLLLAVAGMMSVVSATARQSPIDIVQSATVYDPSLSAAWVINYIPANTQEVTNTGHDAKVKVDYTGSELSGGPLGSTKFCLEQFHFHWGSVNSQGSEHLVEGFAYPAELHLVHWNCETYSSFAEAVPSENGLAVLGVFLQVGEESNEALEEVTDKLDEIKFKGQSAPLSPFDPTGLLPANITSYWNYPGSLTTSPFSETVNWIVFKDPITVTQDQLDDFRDLMTNEEGQDSDDDDGSPLVDNFREPQPLSGRVIKASFT